MTRIRVLFAALAVALCVPAAGIGSGNGLPTTIGKGRIVGGILTLGIQLALQATYDLGRSSGSSTTGGDRGTHGRHGDQDGT